MFLIRRLFTCLFWLFFSILTIFAGQSLSQLITGNLRQLILEKISSELLNPSLIFWTTFWVITILSCLSFAIPSAKQRLQKVAEISINSFIKFIFIALPTIYLLRLILPSIIEFIVYAFSCFWYYLFCFIGFLGSSGFEGINV